MQPDNTPTNNQQPVNNAPQPPQILPPTPPAAQPNTSIMQSLTSQNASEYLMFAFASLTILSFLLGSGSLLKVALSAGMLVGIISICRKLFGTKPQSFDNQYYQSVSQTEVQNTKQRKSTLKIITRVLLIIILIPVIGYGALIALFILMLTMGGGNMGT